MKRIFLFAIILFFALTCSVYAADLVIYDLDIGNSIQYTKELSMINSFLKTVTVSHTDYRDGKLYILYLNALPFPVQSISLHPIKSSTGQTNLINFIQGETIDTFKVLEDDIVLILS